MMRKVLMSLVGIMAVLPLYAVTDCVNETYTIKYDCGAGTVADGKTLPESQTVTYGETVTLERLATADRFWGSLSSLICTAPDGLAWGGIAIYVGDNRVATYGTNTAVSFVYNFTSDITVRPNWVGPATADDLRAAMGSGGNGADGYEWSQTMGYSAHSPNRETIGTWRAYYDFGYVEGDALCTTYMESDFTSTGGAIYIPRKQDLDNADRSEPYYGNVCYCRVKNVPGLDFTPWVFRFSSSWEGCDNNCEGNCADYFAGVEWYRSTVLTGLYENGPTE